MQPPPYRMSLINYCGVEDIRTGLCFRSLPHGLIRQPKINAVRSYTPDLPRLKIGGSHRPAQQFLHPPTSPLKSLITCAVMLNIVLHAMPPTADWVNNLKKQTVLTTALANTIRATTANYRDMPPVRTTTAIVDKRGPHTCITK